MKTKKIACLLLFQMFVCIVVGAELKDSTNNIKKNKHMIQLNALETLGEIYSAVYCYEFSPKNQLMLGLGYQHQYNKYFGRTHAPSLIIGYRRYFWKGLNADFALWPAYNWLYEENEQKYYKSFEVWSEIRVGYDFTFKLNEYTFFILPQYIFGKGITSGNKPQSFHDYYRDKEHLFMTPNIALGFKF